MTFRAFLIEHHSRTHAMEADVRLTLRGFSRRDSVRYGSFVRSTRSRRSPQAQLVTRPRAHHFRPHRLGRQDRRPDPKVTRSTRSSPPTPPSRNMINALISRNARVPRLRLVHHPDHPHRHGVNAVQGPGHRRVDRPERAAGVPCSFRRPAGHGRPVLQVAQLLRRL